MSLQAIAIALTVIGGIAQFFGVIIVVREIAGDRRRARELFDKQRNWEPATLRPPRRVTEHAVAYRETGFSSQLYGGAQGHIDRSLASLVNAHNQLQHDVSQALENRTDAILKEVDAGDNELRDVLRELLRGSIIERYLGVIAITVGIALSMIGGVLSSVAG